MKQSTNSHHEQHAHGITIQNQVNESNASSALEVYTNICPELTLTDVYQALNTLRSDTNQSPERRISSDNIIHPNAFEPEHACCRLLRFNNASHSILPLARRGRSQFTSRPSRVLCSNCAQIKHRQEIDILKYRPIEPCSKSNTQLTIDLDLSVEEQNALNSHDYLLKQTLVWNANKSNGNPSHICHDTNSLTEIEKNILLDQTIRKLQTVLNNQRSTTFDDHQRIPELNSHILQTTIDIISSSQNSI